MTMIEPADWAWQTYDEIVAAHAGDDGIPQDDIKKRFQDAYVVALKRRRIQRPQTDDQQDALNLYAREVDPLRRKRSRRLTRDLEFILDALEDPENGATLLGDQDPQLAAAHLLGTSDGRDKALGAWTRENFQSSALGRYDQAAEATAAAAKFNEVQRRITAAMTAAGAQTLKELFTGPGYTKRETT